MKSTIIRIISALMAVVMLATSFAGCGENKDNEPGVTKPPVVEGPTNDGGNDVNADDTTTTTTSPATTVTTTKPANNTTTTTKPSTGTGSGSLSTSDMNAILNAAGYAYDPDQKIYYSTMNPWHRHFGFGAEFDQIAPYGNMKYTTLKADFEYDGLLWRLQWWKGQYAVLVGAELGVYTKNPGDNSTTFYECASDEHLLDMSFEFYMTAKDYRNGNRRFYREEQAHWWLTGFDFGSTMDLKDENGKTLKYPTAEIVVVATLKAFDHEMADAIEKSFEKLTGAGAGREKFKYVSKEKLNVKDAKGNKPTDCYTREGDTFTVVWKYAGFENY